MTQTVKETVQSVVLSVVLTTGLGLLNYWDSGKIPQSLGDILALFWGVVLLLVVGVLILRPIAFLITGK